MSFPQSRVPNRQSRHVDGILLLDKPLGLSSNQALQRVKRLFAAAKAGHTGSLDPLASGLLPICLGEATKIAGLLLGARKCYEAEVCLGSVTRGDDAEGEVIESRPVPPLDEAALRGVLGGFLGDIRQVPPVYSALKKDGVPLYRLARRGIAVEPQARTVRIDELELLPHAGKRLHLRVTCSAGTYIRSLARDIGAAIGCGAHLSGLRRAWAEPFMAPAMHTLAELEERAGQGGPEALDGWLLPVEAGLAHLPAIDLEPAEGEALARGRPLPSSRVGLFRARLDGRLLALAEGSGDGWLRVRRGFNLPPGSLVADARNPLK